MADIDITLANGQKAGETLKQLTFQAAALRKEISGLKPGTEEFTKASESLKQVKDRMSDINDQVNGTKKASNELKNSWDTLFPGASGQVKFLTGQFAAAKAGVGGLISQFGKLKIAVAAVPLAAAVLALASFSAWLKRTDEGATFLDGKMNQLSGTIDVITGRLIRLGNENFFKSLIDGLEEAFVMGDIMAKWADDLDDLRRETELVSAESGKHVEQLMLQSRNVELSIEDRLELLDKAGMIEADAHEKKREYHEQIIDMINVEMAQAEKNGQVGDDLKDKLNEALIERVRLDRESVAIQEKIANRRSQLLEKEQTEKDRALHQDEQRRQKEEAAQAKKEAEDAARLERKKAAEAEYRDWETTTSAQHLANMQNAATRTLDAAISGIQTKLAMQFEANLREQASDDALNQRKLEWLERIKQADQLAKEQMLGSGLELFNALSAAAIQESQIEIEQAQRRVDEIKKKHGEESVAFRDAQNQLDQIRKIQGERIKKREKSMVEIQLLAELATIWRHAADFGPLSAIVAGVQTIAATVRAQAAIQKINAKQFGGGGTVLRGPSHAHGGIPIEAEGEEIILTKGVYRNRGLRAMASAINAAAGGVRFAADGMAVPTNPFTAIDRPPVPSAASQALGGDPFAELTQLRNDFRVYANRVDKWASTLSVQNNLSEVRKGIATLNKLDADASV